MGISLGLHACVGARAWSDQLYQVTGAGEYKVNGLTVCCEL